MAMWDVVAGVLGLQLLVTTAEAAGQSPPNGMPCADPALPPPGTAPPSCTAAARHVPNDFRNERLYHEEVDLVLKRHQVSWGRRVEEEGCFCSMGPC